MNDAHVHELQVQMWKPNTWGVIARVNVVQSYKVVRINKQAKEVNPDGHGEATCDHELHPHKSAS